MEKTVEELAKKMVKTIEREDFIYSLKHYFYFELNNVLEFLFNLFY